MKKLPSALEQRIVLYGAELRVREGQLVALLVGGAEVAQVAAAQRRVFSLQQDLAAFLARRELLEHTRDPVRQRRHHKRAVATGTTDQDINAARAAVKRLGMLTR